MKEFFAMGGYAFYVWTSYAIAAIALIATAFAARRRHRNEIARITRRIRREKVGSQ